MKFELTPPAEAIRNCVAVVSVQRLPASGGRRKSKGDLAYASDQKHGALADVSYSLSQAADFAHAAAESAAQ